ncbi:MAG: AraC family transcriptional regulator [Planctomycetaceae bacterium]|nr:AraC family transcriptional regulator [Planctomycetaceae bacterium]
MAHRYGFCNHSSMSKEFRRAVGMAPRQYRRQHFHGTR